MVDVYLRYPSRVKKDPQAKRSFTIDWSEDIGDDVITNSSWSTPTESMTVSNSPAASYTNTTTTVWLEGGTAGAVSTVINTITLASGGTDQKTLEVDLSQQ